MALDEGAWQEVCLVQLAEQQAWAGELESAFELCLEAGGLTRLCSSQVSWQGMGARLDIDPTHADAGAQVDAHMAGLPGGGVTGALRGFQNASETARAAAWHSIYAGSGSTDLRALQSASEADAPLARSAFAWEAVRLLPHTLTIEQTIEAVRGLAAGEAPLLAGPPEDLGCATYTVMPLVESDFRLQPVIRAYGSWLRFVDPDPEVDLRVATLDALLIQRGSFEGLAGMADPSEAVQKTIARHVALLAPMSCNARSKDLSNDPVCADLADVSAEGNPQAVRYAAGSMRKALRANLRPRLKRPGGCP
jgi:hypothetical protein